MREKHIEECPLCGGAAREASFMDDIAYGPHKTVQVEVARMVCSECGENFATPDQLDATDERAATIMRARGRILGFEIRRLRMRLGLTQAQFEAVLGLGAKSVTRWERDLVELEGPTVITLRALESGELTIDSIGALRVREEPWPEILEAVDFENSDTFHAVGAASDAGYPYDEPMGYPESPLDAGLSVIAAPLPRTVASLMGESLALAA